MAKQTITLHMYESIEPWNQGARGVLTFDFRGIPVGDGRVWIGQQDVEIDFPDVDMRQLQIDALEAEVKQERAAPRLASTCCLSGSASYRPLAMMGRREHARHH